MRTVTCLLVAAIVAAASQSSAQQPSAAIAFAPYELAGAGGAKVPAELGWLKVPENRSKPAGATIELAVVRLKSAAASPAPPVVYLAGGPGGSAIGEAQIPHMARLIERLRKTRDVILMDQRGTGMSKPRVSWRATESLPTDVFLSEERAAAVFRERSALALADFRARGIDVTGYTTVESADDLEALRVGLGADRLALVGFSYGTHLALATVRRHGARLDAVVLVGTEGPDHTLKLPTTYDAQLAKLSALAAADPGVAAKVPDLVALFGRVLARLEREPVTVEIEDRRTKTKVRIPVGKAGFQTLVRIDIGDGNDFPEFPAMFYALEHGDASRLAGYVEKRYNQFGAGLSGMAAVTDLASGATAERRARILRESRESLFGNVMNFPDMSYGDVWGAPDLGDAFRAPIRTTTRTLFVSGTLDANTPPYQAEELRWGFSNSAHIVVEYAGHEDTLPNDEVQSAIADFLAGKDVGGVRVALPRPRFVPVN
jgi:pimeloyl-ACP methyl ester carboxylesterase